ncbi:MAG TPA: hypothetical protein VIE63_12585 [Ramlibacter sp.]
MKKTLPLFALAFALAANAQPSSCSSDGVAPPRALLERFINADCEQCWQDPQTPGASSGTLAIDWVAPGSRGDDAPLSAVATRDGADRLDALGKQPPAQSSSHFTLRSAGAPLKLRVAHGLPFNEYVGTSIEMQPAPGGPWKAWLLLVETLPAGSEGSPVERNLVRNAFVADWPATTKAPAPKRYELRPMRVAEGTKFERLRVVGWVEDPKGRIRAIAQSRCEK